MSARLEWDRDGLDWPHRGASRFVEAAGMNWHVQQFGAGPPILLIHGTAASTHSWKDIAPYLAEHAAVLSIDLPGHAFSAPLAKGVMSLDNVAAAVGELLDTLNVKPASSIGHSAGAAILLRMARRGLFPKRAKIISLNGALRPFDGFPGRLFSPLAKLLAGSPLVASIFNWRATDSESVARVLAGTGSKVDAESLKLYGRLFRNPSHVAAALSMMAHWDLTHLVEDIKHLTNPLTLVACGNDRAVPPEIAFDIRDRMPAVNVEFLRGLGHLAHEEDPPRMAQVLGRLCVGEPLAMPA